MPNAFTEGKIYMIINNFMPARIISGVGCVKNNSSVFSSYGKSCLIVCGGSSASKSGALSDVCQALTKEDIQYEIFDKIQANPHTETCFEGGKIAREISADFIVGIGGGSPQDSAKAIAIYASNPDMPELGIYNRSGCNRPLPVILVGTTSGTGSEVTGVSVLTRSDNGFKQSVSGPDCYASLSFCDYTYTKSMPRNVAISTALDAYAHASESYLASTANDISRLYAAKALPMLFQVFRFFESGEEITDEIREKQYIASIYAGLAINITGCLFPHTLGYALTELYGIPHGKACTAFHGLLIEKAEEHSPERMAEIYRITSTTPDEYRRIVSVLTDVHINMGEDKARTLSERWINGNKNFNKTPGGVTTEDIARVLAEI